jgi:hypothetical protein
MSNAKVSTNSSNKVGSFVQGSQAVFIVAIIILCITLLIQYISLRFQYKPLYDWWAQNNGVKYDNLFSIFTIASANNNTILYYLNKLFVSPMSSLSIVEIRFIYTYVLPSLRYNDDNGQHGYLTPRTLCSSILPSIDDGDFLFTTWLHTAQRSGKAIDINKPLKYGPPITTKDPKNPNITNTTFTYEDPTTSQGLFPSAGDYTSWMGLIMDWLNGTDGGQTTYGGEILYVWQTDADDIPHPVLIDSSTKNPTKFWFDPQRGDNFLSRLNIHYNSDLITSYVSQKASTGSLRIDAFAFANLVGGSSALAGGFIGFLQGIAGEAVSADHYASLLYADSYINSIKPPPTCTQSSAGRGIMAGLGSVATTGFSILMMAAFAGPTGGLSLGAGLGLGALGLFTAGTSAYQAGKGTCST